MSWGISFRTEFNFNRASFDSKEDVKNALEEAKDLAEKAKQSIFALCIMTEPNKMLQVEEGMSAVETVQYLTEDLFKSYEEAVIQVFKLEDLYNNWDKCKTDYNEDDVYAISKY